LQTVGFGRSVVIKYKNSTKMATPEKIAFQPEQTPDLRLIPGGLAVEQSVEIIHATPMPFDEFAQSLNESSWADMSAEELLTIRGFLSEYTGDLAILIHTLQQQHDKATSKKIWINGFIRDRL
jgi:hypothetical protein